MKVLRTATLALLLIVAAVVCGCYDKVFEYAIKEAKPLIGDTGDTVHGHQPDSTECDSIGPVHPHCE